VFHFIGTHGGDDKVVQRSVDGYIDIIKQSLTTCISVLRTPSEKRLLGRDSHRKMHSALLFNDVLFSLRLIQWKKQCTENGIK